MEFPTTVKYGSFDYPIPARAKIVGHDIISELPKFSQRPAAHWTGKPLGSTFQETIHGSDPQSRSDILDPAMTIVLAKRKQVKQFKLGSIEFDVYGNKKPLTKLINKFIQKESLNSTPMKRIRDEVAEVGSLTKKNKRIVSVTQADTTMELSFEGKAMDRSDIVKLVDSSGILQDESQIVDADASMIDTRNLLQSSDFNFEYRR